MRKVHGNAWKEAIRLVSRDLEQVIDTGEELGVDSKARVQGVSRLSHEAHGVLVLVHDDGGAEGRAVGEQLECERG